MVHHEYLRELDRRLHTALGSSLDAVYLIGSAALGDFVEGESDLDVVTLCGERPPPAALEAVVAAARHEALPCPARLLELVLYSRESLRRRPVEFELNLNSGAGEATRWSTDPASESFHWFTLDLAIARGSALALSGPAAAELLPELKREDIVPALLTSLDWHEREATPRQLLGAAARAWRYAEAGDWPPKREAARWALARAAPEQLPARARAALTG